MADAAEPLQRLILELGRLPGVGPRSATRLAVYLIKDACRRRQTAPQSPSIAQDLAQALSLVDARAKLCRQCHNIGTSDNCDICSDEQRDSQLLCVVEDVADLRAIEATSMYRGLYHVLHGSVSPLDGLGPESLFLDDLPDRVERLRIQEIIIATHSDVEGDTTALFVGQMLAPLKVQVSRIASGIPMGGELEYVDQATLGRALMERRPLT